MTFQRWLAIIVVLAFASRSQTISAHPVDQDAPSDPLHAIFHHSPQITGSASIFQPSANSSSPTTAESGTSQVQPVDEYQPLPGCENACAALLDDKDKCDDDSCICSQQGVNDFVSCALCDTRLATKQAKINLNATLHDLKEICEYEGFSFTNITLPTSTTLPSTPTMSDTTSQGHENTAIRLSSAAYASISIASGTAGFVTTEGALGATSAIVDVGASLGLINAPAAPQTPLRSGAARGNALYARAAATLIWLPISIILCAR